MPQNSRSLSQLGVKSHFCVKHIYGVCYKHFKLAVWVAYMMTQLGIATKVYVIKVKVTVTKNRNSVSAQLL